MTRKLLKRFKELISTYFMIGALLQLTLELLGIKVFSTFDFTFNSGILTGIFFLIGEAMNFIVILYIAEFKNN